MRHFELLRGGRRCGNFNSRRLAAGLGLLALLAGDRLALAQAPTVGAPDAGRYMSTFWLTMFLLLCVAWLGIFDWVGRDSERNDLRQRFWSAILMLVGGAGMALMILVWAGLVFPALLGLGAVFAVYVQQRNESLPPENRIFTPEHLRYLRRVLSERLRFRRSGAKGGRPEREGVPQIELLRKDGTSLEKLTDARSGSEAVLSIKELVESAVFSRATDIHLEPKEDELQARLRIDGILHSVPSYAADLAAPMLSSVKVISDMDIAEKRKPQDGSFMGRLGGRVLDFRVATTPSVHGETMAIRILDRDVGLVRLDKLGLLPDHMEIARRVIQYPNGMLIVCGPTGAGKSTTLYAMLSEIDAYQRNILTIEDPIEYRLDNVTQTPVNVKAGVTFASSLRSMLRQDPDVIMVGEIRDAETARTACQAAMTGHFVFTTLHANDSVTSLFRLLDLGVESYFIASSLSAVLAQRLVRILCPACKVAYEPEAGFFEKVGVPADRKVPLYKAEGCEQCQGTGYKGRLGIFELLEVTDGIKELLRTNPTTRAVTEEAKKQGFRKLHEDGVVKVIKGITSVTELLRVTR